MLNYNLVTFTPMGLISINLNRDGATEACRMRPVIRVKTENIIENCVKTGQSQDCLDWHPTSSKPKEILNSLKCKTFCVQGATKQKPQKEVVRFDVPLFGFQILSFYYICTVTSVYDVVVTSSSVVVTLVRVPYGLRIWPDVEINLGAVDRPDDKWWALHGRIT
jgi:hypothetical protein